MLLEKQETLQAVKDIFGNYLEQRKQRKTPERFAILEEVYLRNDHYDAETLYLEIRNKNYNISRATVYNTLELLLACNLVTRHQFGKNFAQYEKSFGYGQHDHAICTNCRKVVEFCDPRIQQIQNMMAELLDFKITNHSLNLFGLCADCAKLTKNETEKKG